MSQAVEVGFPLGVRSGVGYKMEYHDNVGYVVEQYFICQIAMDSEIIQNLSEAFVRAVVGERV